MAKRCSICGKRLGFFDGRVQVSNGLVCTSCWSSAGFDMSFESMSGASTKTTEQVRDLIGIETLKTETKREKRRKNKKPQPPKKSAEQIKEQVKEESGKAVDIFIDVSNDRHVGFGVKGHPVINFDDLVNGKEMIIGDGFIRNKADETLPEIRIACEFKPAIVDPGLLYYEEGTFQPGVQGKFEIDDPPVNLEEYAKIKRTRKGKIRFKLFFAEKELASSECEMIIKPAPKGDMENLIKSVVYEQEKNASGPVNVFLYARDSGTFDLDLMRHPELLYSMYSNGQEQLIGDVYVSNESGRVLKNIEFEATFTSDILSPVKILLGDVPKDEKLAFEVDDPAIDVDKLERLTEVETCIATYKLSVNGKTVAESTGKIDICPYNQWNAALILLPAYMTPNHPNIIKILQNASNWMLVNGMNPSLEGYQSDGKRVEEMIRGVYNAVKEANIIYSNPPASFFGPQRIRLCETVFKQKFATCMDMTILFASCLESFGLHPVLITAPGHIFAGVWLNGKSRLQEPILSDAKLIKNYIDSGKLVAVECTAMNAGNDSNYEDAKKTAYEIIKTLADNGITDHECIDVQIARAIGVRPLPMRIHKNNTPRPGVSSDTDNAVNKTKPADSKNKKSKKSTGSKETDKPKKDSKVVDNQHPTYALDKYVEFDDDLSNISIDNFYEKQTKKILKDAIVKIVSVEGPISQPALVKTIIEHTSLGRAGKQINEHLDKLVAAANVKITRQSGVRFLWKYGTNPSDYMIYRTGNQRYPEDICKYELKNAVCYILQENGPMNRDELVRQLISLFGFSRSSKKLEDGANDAIKAARSLKAIEIDDNRNFKNI